MGHRAAHGSSKTRLPSPPDEEPIMAKSCTIMATWRWVIATTLAACLVVVSTAHAPPPPPPPPPPRVPDPAAGLTVRTRTGLYTGLVDHRFPHVRQFRDIPYALPPVGRRRWRPPVPAPPSARPADARRFPPACPQYVTRQLSVWNTYLAGPFSIDLAGQDPAAGAPAQTAAEDCLRLAVYSPAGVPPGARLPVALFVHGGSFQTGGLTVPYQIPAPWVERSRRHLVVAAQYRLGVLGFPYARALAGADQNLGLLDLRAALEWTRDNVAAFGGDPARITLWGQSAGAVAADMLAYAYPHDPVAAALFLQSGTALVNVSYPDRQYRNFTYAARQLGCAAADPDAELRCMQRVPAARLVDLAGRYADDHADPRTGLPLPGVPQLRFKPMPDDRTLFFNYSERAARGLLARVPALVGATANEEASLFPFVPVPRDAAERGPNQTLVDAATVAVFVCLTANATDARARQGLTTYRYQFAGRFRDTTPLPWLGAYHASDIPLLMGTYDARAATALERRVSAAMQDDLLAFLEDPRDGLRVRRGWPPHDGRVAQGGPMMRFAGADGRVARVVDAREVDDACVRGAPYDSSP